MKPVTEKLIESTFFPVEKRRLFWEDESFFSNESSHVPCKNLVAIVDMEHKYVFTAATPRYAIFLNRRAYDLGMDIAYELLKANDDNDIECVACSIGRNYATVEYNFCGRMYINQPHLIEGWMPVITIQNSYNKTKPLVCVLGFRHIEYGVNILFPQISAKASSSHDGSPSAMEHDIHVQIYDKKELISTFTEYFLSLMKELKNTRIAPTDMLPLFCKIQKIKKVKKLPEMQLKHLINSLKFVQERINIYTQKYEYTAYTLLLVIADYIENLNPEKRRLVISEQMALGAWVEKYLKECSKEDFSPYEYIGKEAYDAASWFGTLK